MMRARRHLLVAGLLLLCLQVAGAAPEGEADAVARLLASGKLDDVELARVARTQEHDSWLLVEHLLARGKPDVAKRLAQQADEAVVGPVGVYASMPAATKDAAARLQQLAKLGELLRSGKPAALLEELSGDRDPPATVFGVQGAVLRGDALIATGRTGDGIEAWIEAGEAALQLGWWKRARGLFSRALGFAYTGGSYELAARAGEGERAVIELQADAEGLAGVEFNLGAIAQLRGDLPRALRHLDESLHLSETLARPQDAASARSVRSFVLAELGEFAEAMEAQRVLGEYFRDRPRDGAWVRNRLSYGLIRYRVGDSDGATTAFREALEAARTSKDTEVEAQALDNLGHAYLQQERWEDAIDAFRTSLTLLTNRDDAYGVATLRLNLANALRTYAEALQAGRVETETAAEQAAAERKALVEARELIAKVATVAEQAGAEGMACHARLTLARILIAEGQRKQALELVERTRDEAKRLRAWTLRVLSTVVLARLHALEERWDAALREAHAAAEELGRSYAGLAESDLARARALTPDVFDIGVRAAERTKNDADLMYFLEAGRAAALLRGLGGRAAALRATVPAPVAERLAKRTRARLDAFTAWRSKRGNIRGREERALWRTYKAARDAEQKALDELLREQTLAAGRLAPRRVTSIRGLRSRLRTTARPGLRQVFAILNMQRDEATALMVESKGTRLVRWEGEELAELRTALENLGEARDGDLDPANLAALKSRFVDRLGIPAGTTRLYLSPDRELAYAPLAAVIPDDWELVWQPSATTFDLLAERRLRKGQGVLGLGDPDYGRVPDPDVLARRGGARLVRLESSRQEILDIAGTDRDRKLLFGEATERKFARALEGEGAGRHWRSVHLACHGLVDVERPEFSSLALTPGDGEDGLLTSGEILRLNMRTDLAVLSACRTGRGKFMRSEGLMSLARAFMFAGAPRVIVSLWDVPDDSTAHLMKAFYRAMAEGKSTAAALRSAQIAVRDHEEVVTVAEPGRPPKKVTRRPWADPSNWAAWVLWGLPD